jgi:VanZ family protein
MILPLLVIQFFPLSVGRQHHTELSRLVDFMHFPLMLGLWVPAFLLLRSLLPLDHKRSAWRIWLLLLLLSAGVEAVQPLWGRTASISDWIIGAMGAAAGMMLWYAWALQERRYRFCCILAALVLLVVSLLPLALYRLERHLAHRDFPLLAGFERETELMRWEANDCSMERVACFSTEGACCAKVYAFKEHVKYPGVFLSDMPGQWSGMQGLSADVRWLRVLPQWLWVRIDDNVQLLPYGQRFQCLLMITQGVNRIYIRRADFTRTSGNRPMNLENVARIGFFLDQPEPDAELYLDNIKLIPEGAE